MALQRARDGDGERGDVGEESREREPRIQGHDEGGLERAKGAARGVDVGRLDSELLTGCSASCVPCECQQGNSPYKDMQYRSIASNNIGHVPPSLMFTINILTIIGLS